MKHLFVCCRCNISGVKCQKAELVDLSERPDVERYDWDGADIDFETPIQ